MSNLRLSAAVAVDSGSLAADPEARAGYFVGDLFSSVRFPVQFEPPPSEYTYLAEVSGDFKASSAVSAVAVWDHNLLPASGAWRVVLFSGAGGTGSAVYESGLIYGPNTAAGGVYHFAPAQARSFVVTFYGTAADAYLSVGRVFFGSDWSPGRNFDAGLLLRWVDPSPIYQSGGGTALSIARVPYRELALTLSELEEADRAGLFALIRQSGQRGDFLVEAFPGLPDALARLEFDHCFLGKLAPGHATTAWQPVLCRDSLAFRESDPAGPGGAASFDLPWCPQDRGGGGGGGLPPTQPWLPGPALGVAEVASPVVMVGNEDGEVGVSADDGYTWALAASPGVGAIFALAGDGHRFIAAGETGVAWTLDRGATWARSASLDAYAPFDAAHYSTGYVLDGGWFVSAGYSASAVFQVDVEAGTWAMHADLAASIIATRILIAEEFGYLHVVGEADPAWCQSAPLPGLDPWQALSPPETSLDGGLVAAAADRLMLIPRDYSSGDCEVWTATDMALGVPDISQVATAPFGVGVLPLALRAAGDYFCAAQCDDGEVGFWCSLGGDVWDLARPGGVSGLPVWAVARGQGGHYVAVAGDGESAKIYRSVTTAIGTGEAAWIERPHPLSGAVIQAIAP